MPRPSSTRWSISTVHFNKDIALAGAALVFFAVFAATGDLGLTLTGPVFATWIE